MDIGESIDRLDAMLRRAGFRGLVPPADDGVLDEIAEHVSPHRLPDDVRRFWQRVDPAALPIALFPELVAPRTALELARGNRSAPPAATGPPLLFPIAYASHVFRSVELDSEWEPGGAIYRCALDDDPIRRTHGSLAELLEEVARLVERGRLERRGGFLLVELDADDEPPPGAEVSRGDPASWPARWRASAGIDLDARRPLGVTHTIAALIGAARAGPARGRIHGVVRRLAGSPAGTLALVDDGSGTLEVWCPAGAGSAWPSHGRRFEFDVRLDAAIGPAPDTADALDVRPL